MVKGLLSLHDLILSKDVIKEEKYHNQFTLGTLAMKNFMKLDLAAIYALSIFPKNMDDLKKADNQNSSSSLFELLNSCKT